MKIDDAKKGVEACMFPVSVANTTDLEPTGFLEFIHDLIHTNKGPMLPILDDEGVALLAHPDSLSLEEGPFGLFDPNGFFLIERSAAAKLGIDYISD